MIDQELKKRALEPAAKGDPAPREKVLKVGKMITDVIEHKSPLRMPSTGA